MIMCRVNPKNIRQPENFIDSWLLNPNSNEIRPYRILIKKISNLVESSNIFIRVSDCPIDYIISAIKSKDISFYNLSEHSRFKEFSYLNGKKLSNDNFSIRLYTSQFYAILNNYLREKKLENRLFIEDNLEDKKINEEYIKSWIYCLHLAIGRNSNIKDNTIVYKSISSYYFSSDIGIGSKFFFREFFSTSLSKKIAKEFLHNRGTFMTITIKNNGTNGFPNYCLSVKDISLYQDLDEVIITCHCCFIVTKRERKNEIDYVNLICEGYLFE